MKKSFLKIQMGVFLSATCAFCAPQLVDGIALFVNGKPVTLLEVYATQSKAKVSQQVAVDMLINEKLHLEEIEKRQLSANDLEIDDEIAQIAKAHKTTVDKVKDYTISNGGSWEVYREEIKKNLLKKKLYQSITRDSLRMVDERDLLDYYNNNKQEFSIPQSVDAVKFYSKNGKDIEALLASNGANKAASVKMENEILQVSALNPKIVPAFAQTQVGAFTPIFPIGEDFVTFKIKAKNNPTLMPYENVKNLIMQKMMTQKEDYVIYEHFEKLRSNAKVNIIRLN